MSIANLMKLTLVVSVAVQLVSAEAFAKSHETILVKKEGQNKYFQIKSRKIQELSDEEALEFTFDKGLALLPYGPNFPGNIIIPPKPPEAGGGIVGPGTTPIGGVTIPTTPIGGVTPTPTPTGAIDGIIMIADKLIAIGQKIIPTIKEGKAVVTNNPMSAVSVLPRVSTVDPVVHDMEDWSLPVTKHYKISYENGLGNEVVSFVYSITYQYGGTYNGQGKYLTGIRASARKINIAWGFDLDATSQLIQISNIGKVNNVIAAATIEMSYTIKNWTRQMTTNEGFFVAGDGRLFKLDQ